MPNEYKMRVVGSSPNVLWPAEGLVLPSVMKVAVTDARLPFDLDLQFTLEAGWIVCERFTAQRRAGGSAITNADLRIPIERIGLQAARDIATSAHQVGNDWVLDPTQRPANVGRVLKGMKPTSVAAKHRAPERAKNHQALLRKVVRSYRKCADTRAPARTIGNELGYSESYVKKLLVEARTLEMLGPAIPGRSGEAKSTGKRRAT